jgi:hypothetical protein
MVMFMQHEHEQSMRRDINRQMNLHYWIHETYMFMDMNRKTDSYLNMSRKFHLYLYMYIKITIDIRRYGGRGKGRQRETGKQKGCRGERERGERGDRGRERRDIGRFGRTSIYRRVCAR